MCFTVTHLNKSVQTCAEKHFAVLPGVAGSSLSFYGVQIVPGGNSGWESFFFQFRKVGISLGLLR